MFKKIVTEQKKDVKILYLSNGKSNAIDEELIEEIKTASQEAEKSEEFKSLIITSRNKVFFSSGFDIFEVIKYNRSEMRRFFLKYLRLYRYLFGFPKPLIFAINGHSLAGGFILTLTGDFRICANVKNLKIGLNELKMGVPIPYGSVKMLQFVCGRNANFISLSAKNLSPFESKSLGVVDEIVSQRCLVQRAIELAKELSQKPHKASRKIKAYLKADFLEKIAKNDELYVEEFLNVWFSKETRDKMKELLKNISR